VTAEDVRVEARAAFAAALTPRRPDQRVTVLGAGADDLAPGRAFLAALAPDGWAVPTWPRDCGGRDATAEEAAVIADELAAYEAPDLYPYLVGLHVVGPTLVTLATPAQRTRWLPAIAAGTEIWCQLFSEPGAGSDLANVATRATRDGDTWHVTGQKVWSSRAAYAQRGFLLARTDPAVPKHAGITAFALDLAAPGVTVRPLRQMNHDAHFSEVFLDDAPVADADRIGEPGAGWRVARTALANERGAVGAASAGTGLSPQRLVSLLRAQGQADDPWWRNRVAGARITAEAARLSRLRARARVEAGQTPGPEGSGAKLHGTATFRAAVDVAMGLLGPDGIAGSEPTAEEWRTLFLTAPSLSIRGGTDEIQRNIVGERVLGLPPEPRVDAERPWNEVPH
jgi:alkylation response protein AidB-like acyl-CoA dehydrogenase